MRTLVLLGFVAGCGASGPNQPHGSIAIDNATLRSTGSSACGATGTVTCQFSDISFTLDNSAPPGMVATSIVRVDEVSLTIGNQTFAPSSAPTCDAGPWMVQGGRSSGLIDVTVQTGDPYLSFHCGSYDVQVQMPGLPAMPSTGMIGLTIEGLMGDASPFKAVAPVTIL